MKKKDLSVLIIPHRGRVKHRRVSYSKIWLTFLILFLFFGAGAFSTVNYLKHRWDDHQLLRLRTEREVLEKKLSDMEFVISELKLEMNQLMAHEKKIRLVFGLPEVDDAVREVGVGGPNPFPYSTGSNMELGQAVADVDKLLRQTRFERESLTEIHTQLLEKRDLLEHTPSLLPTKGYLSRGFGVKTDPFTGLRQPHWGIDLAADVGTPVYASADGTIFFTGWHHGLGKLIIINHGYGYRTHYGHLHKIKVKKGQKVERGEVIGVVGNTGYSTGPHLHYEVHSESKAVNPQDYILSQDYIFD